MPPSARIFVLLYAITFGTIATQGAPLSAATLTNPVIWNDLADLDIFRLNDTYYYMASSMHFSPGAPILQSKDLVSWEYISFAVPSLQFNSPAYSLEDGMRAYARGIWASTLRYRQSNSKWYFIGCVDFNATHFYTSDTVDGPFEQSAVLNGTCLYDCGLLIDDDDTMYVTHGSTNLSVAQLTPDGLDVAKDQVVHTGDLYIEGSRMYKRNGHYYIITDQPVNGQYVLKSSSGPFGPYEFGVVLNNTLPPVSLLGADTPHQGSFVDTPDGDWYYMAFVDLNVDATGRVPVLSSLTWTDEGWPVLDLAANNTWPTTLPYPVDSGARTPNTDQSLVGIDKFQGNKLDPQWEWNHNPDLTKICFEGNAGEGGLRLYTATITKDLYQARNTLTHRTLGPVGSGTVLLDFSSMRKGDFAGLAMFRDSSAWIGVHSDAATGAKTLVQRTGLVMNGSANWETVSIGNDVKFVSLEKIDCNSDAIYLRTAGDFRPAGPVGSGTLQASFSYSVDGTTWTGFGENLTMVNDYQFFQAYRYAVFNYATVELGGSVVLKEFEIGNEQVDR